MINLQDNLTFKSSTREITDEGYLKATAALTSVGIQQYKLSDITGNAKDTKIVNVFRPSSTVFSDKTMQSAKLKPITMLHPSNMVDSDNHHNLAVGTIGENVHKLDDDRLGANIVVNNKSIIDDIMSGKVSEVSMGYTADIKAQVGEYKGKHYDYMFDGAMTINHCAIVPKGRCGSNVSILDKKEGDEMSKEDKQVTITDKEAVNPALSSNGEHIKSLINDESFKEALKGLMAEIEKEKASDSNEADKEVMAKDKEGSKEPIKDGVDSTIENDASSDSQLADNAVTKDEEQNKSKELKDSIDDQVKVRVKIIGGASKILRDTKLDDLDNRQILELCFKDHTDKSDDYLIGRLDSILDDHKSAKVGLKNINDSYATMNNKYYSVSEIKNL